MELVSENELKEKIETDLKVHVSEEVKGQVINEILPNEVKEQPLNPSENISLNENKPEEIKESVDEHKVMVEVNKAKEVKAEKSVSFLSDADLYKELLRHTETVASFKRVFETLKRNYKSDPLLDVELDQGKKILNLIFNKVKEQFTIQREMPELYEYKDNLFKEIHGIQNIITDLLLNLGGEESFKQLLDTT